MVLGLTTLGASLFGAQALSIGFGYAQQVKNAEKLAKYQQQLQEESVKNAAAYASEAYGATLARSLQIQEGTAEQKFAASREARRTAASEKVASSQAGVVGATVGDVQREFSRKMEDFVSISDRQFAHQLEQNRREMGAIRIQAQNSIYRADPVQEPSIAGAVGSLLGSYMGAYAGFGAQ